MSRDPLRIAYISNFLARKLGTGEGRLVAFARAARSRGHQVTVFDPNAENAKAVTGARQAASLVELSATNDIIVSMLPSGRELKVAYLDNDGIVTHAKAGALLIDCSTTDVDSARTVADAAKKRGLEFGGAHVAV